MASVIEHFEALQLPHQQQDSTAAADLVWARSLWNSLTGSIFSASALITAAALDEASGHSGVLHFINQCIELSHYVDGFQNIMHRCTLAFRPDVGSQPNQASDCLQDTHCKTVQICPSMTAIVSSSGSIACSCWEEALPAVVASSSQLPCLACNRRCYCLQFSIMKACLAHRFKVQFLLQAVSLLWCVQVSVSY